MVINGGSRSGSSSYTAYLGTHLQRTDTNERIYVRELDGIAALDLTDALREMAAVGDGARSRLPLYHANIDWRHDELMTDAQKVRAVERLGEELGLGNQPRVVIEHVKAGREHLHVVWSRIDGETLKVISDSFNYRKHEIVARELEREFEHTRVQGAHHEREGVDRPDRCPTLGETRQAERSGMTPEEAKAQLRELWQFADNGQAFSAALDNAGWTLAQGDRRGFVAIDPTGEARAVNKAVTGLTAAQVRERLTDLDAEQLPTVDQARDQLRARQQAPEPAPAPEIDHGADELARLEAMAQEFDSRDYGDQAPDYEPVQDDFGHGYDEGVDLAHEREAHAEARARDDMAAFEAERAALRQEIAEHNERVADLDAITEAVREQFRQQREALNQAERDAAASEYLAEQTRQRGDDSASRARNAMEDLARIDPHGTARNFGHHAGDRLKSPEEMRREWANLMRGGVSAERAAENAAAWEKSADRREDPAQDPRTDKSALDTELDSREKTWMAQGNGFDRLTPEHQASARDSFNAWQAKRDASNERPGFTLRDYVDFVQGKEAERLGPEREARAERDAKAEELAAPQLDQVNAQSRDHLADRTAWAERLRGFPLEAAPEARREAEADRTHERTREPEARTLPPEKERGGLFQKLRDFVRGLFETAPQPEAPRDRAADRQHDGAAGDRQEEHTRPTPATQQPRQEQAPQRQPEQERQRPAERVRSVAEEIMQEAKAAHARKIAELHARETPKERADRERAERAAEVDLSRGRGDGSRERTRHHHGLLWELLHPFHDHSRHDHYASRRPEP